MVKSSYVRTTTKTRRKIQSAFAELLSERGTAKNISVTDLAERAEITRGTFYNYYNNINEVNIELQGEIEKHLFEAEEELNSVESIEKYIDNIFAFLKQQEDIYRELLASSASAGFLDQIQNEMSKSVLTVMHKLGITSTEAETDAVFLTNGAIAVTRKYFKGETTMTLDDIHDYLRTKLYWMLENYSQ
jgi:AcrR family transcriptional regulator